MKTKTATFEQTHAGEILNMESTPKQEEVIYYKKARLKSETSFHKKMILITLLSCLALAVLLLFSGIGLLG